MGRDKSHKRKERSSGSELDQAGWSLRHQTAPYEGQHHISLLRFSHCGVCRSPSWGGDDRRSAKRGAQEALQIAFQGTVRCHVR